MITLHDVAAIRAAEQAHAEELASGVLMDRAAHGVAAAVIDLLQQVFGSVVGARVVLLIGSGNNGGDALFAGVKLLRRGVRVVAITSSSTFHDASLCLSMYLLVLMQTLVQLQTKSSMQIKR